LNKKNVLAIAGLVALAGMPVRASVAHEELKRDFRILDNFVGLTLFNLSVKHYQNTGVPLYLDELVAGNEDIYRNAVGGTWNGQTRECLNVSAKHCTLITGSMVPDGGSGKAGRCIIK